jgi:hypothetical protein
MAKFKVVMDAIKAGTTLEMELTYPGYNSDTYDIEIALRGPAVIDIKELVPGVTITGSGDTYSIQVTAAATALWTSYGMYWYSIILTDGTKRYEVATGSVEILRNLSAITTGTYDGRSHVKKTLDALEAVIEGRATSDVLSYSIAGRQISKIPITELLTLRDKYKTYYNDELTAEKLARGESAGGKIYVRF